MCRTAYFHNDVYIPLNVPRTNSMRTDNTDPRYSHAIAGHARNNCALLGPSSTEDLSEVGEACVIHQLWRPWEEPSNPGLSLPTINSRLDVTSIVFEVRILIYRFNLPSFVLSNITRLEDYTYPCACILHVCFTRLLLYCLISSVDYGTVTDQLFDLSHSEGRLVNHVTLKVEKNDDIANTISQN